MLTLLCLLSPEAEHEDLPSQKKKKTGLTDWLNKKTEEPAKTDETSAQPRKVSKSMKPASPKAKEKRVAALKRKKIVESESEKSDKDEGSDFDDLPKPPPRKNAPGRAAAAKSKYVELSSDDENGDDSMFADD